MSEYKSKSDTAKDTSVPVSWIIRTIYIIKMIVDAVYAPQ